jgi:hypothetical protein
MKQSLTVSESYWGYAAIAARMGWRSIKPLYRHIKQHSFPAYKRIDPRNRFRVMWFTHEGLILRWEDQNRVIVTRSRGEKRKQRFV